MILVTGHQELSLWQECIRERTEASTYRQLSNPAARGDLPDRQTVWRGTIGISLVRGDQRTVQPRRSGFQSVLPFSADRESTIQNRRPRVADPLSRRWWRAARRREIVPCR